MRICACPVTMLEVIRLFEEGKAGATCTKDEGRYMRTFGTTISATKNRRLGVAA